MIGDLRLSETKHVLKLTGAKIRALPQEMYHLQADRVTQCFRNRGKVVHLVCWQKTEGLYVSSWPVSWARFHVSFSIHQDLLMFLFV